MTTPDERLEALRNLALAAEVEPVTDPGDLARLSVRALMRDVGIAAIPDRPEMLVRLYGPGVVGHEIPVRQATAILSSIQESIASIGQALALEPTSRGVIQAEVLKATELRLSPDVGIGSVVFQLKGPAQGTQFDTPESAPSGFGTLVEAALSELFQLVEQSEGQGLQADALARELRRLGPRSAKHLSDLMERVLTDQISVDFTWYPPSARRRHASLQGRSARVIRLAIERNKIETTVVELTGILQTVSTVKKAELRTQDRGLVLVSVDNELAGEMGPYYNREVVVTAEQTTKWSTSTGTETRTFRLLEIREVGEGMPTLRAPAPTAQEGNVQEP